MTLGFPAVSANPGAPRWCLKYQKVNTLRKLGGVSEVSGVVPDAPARLFYANARPRRRVRAVVRCVESELTMSKEES